MSLWIYKRDKAGKKILWQIDFDILTILLLIGLLGALAGPYIFGNPSVMVSLPFAFSTVGLLLLIISKISLYRKGIWFSFGPRQMTKGFATVYKVAYCLITIGVLVQILLLNALRRA